MAWTPNLKTLFASGKELLVSAMHLLVDNIEHVHEGRHLEVYAFVHSGAANSIWNNATPGVTHRKVLAVWRDGIVQKKTWITWTPGGSSITFNATAKSESGLPGEFDFGEVEVLLVVNE